MKYIYLFFFYSLFGKVVKAQEFLLDSYELVSIPSMDDVTIIAFTLKPNSDIDLVYLREQYYNNEMRENVSIFLVNEINDTLFYTDKRTEEKMLAVNYPGVEKGKVLVTTGELHKEKIPKNGKTFRIYLWGSIEIPSTIVLDYYINEKKKGDPYDNFSRRELILNIKE